MSTTSHRSSPPTRPPASSPGRTAAPWFVTLTSQPDARWRLIGFPYGGGGPQAFRGWPELLGVCAPVGVPDGGGADVELLAANLPGRGSRLDEPPISDLPTLADALADALVEHLDKPFAFFGHSVGALVAFEVARRLQARGLPAPLRVFVSAHTAPAVSADPAGDPTDAPTDAPADHAASAPADHAADDPADATTPMYALPDAELLDVVRRLGLVPADALADPELVELILPPLRADFELSETYTAADGPPLRAPLTALGGTDDDLATPADLAAWERHTTGGFATRTFVGDHFYTASRTREVVETIVATVSADIAALPPSLLEGPVEEYPRDACLHELFRAQAARTPEAVAVVDGDRSLTFRELDECTDLLARALQGRGVRVDSLVGIRLPTSADFVIGYLAALKAGGAYLPIDTTYPEALLEQTLTAADPVVVLTDGDLADALPARWRERSIILSDGWLERIAEAAPPTFDESVRPGPDSLAYCVMSSGTTGEPKGILCPHRGAVNSYHWRYRHVPYGEDEREACNVFFVWEVMRPILRGRPAYIVRDDVIFDPPRLVRFLHEQRITRVLFTPSLLEQVLGTPGLDLETAFEHLRVVYLNGEVVTTSLAQRFTRRFAWIRLLNDYSISETHDVCTTDLATVDPTLSPRYAPLGEPMGNVRVYLLDDELRPVPQGFTGEIYVGGDSLARGYLARAELSAAQTTAQRFVPDPLRADGSLLFRTGDSGRLLANGYLEVAGRIAFMIKLRGYSIVPGAVESALTAHDGVDAALVTTLDDPATGQPEHLVAYVVSDGSVEDDALVAQLRTHLRRRLAPYAVPSYIVPLTHLPLAATGKVDRRELPAPPRPGARGQTLLDPPTTRLERLVADAWAGELGLEAVEAGVNFFDVGGHSLAAAGVCARLRERGLTVSVIDVFTYPTVRALAASLDDAPGPDSEDSEPAVASAAAAPAPAPAPAPGEPIAVVGVACRFPGAPDADAFWRTIRDGTRSIRDLTQEELRERGVPADVLADPDYRRIGALVDGVEEFEPAFWGISAKAATLLDPQHRLFLECCWQALENAGHAPRTDGARTGVFGGVFLPTYLLHHLRGGGLLDPRDPMEAHLTEIGNDKDYVTTRVSHLLDLRGPSINVQTSCSTSLVAVAMACQSLQAGACDTALAGASSLTFPQAGYQYAEGHINSRDGWVRPFDAGASGTVLGDGVGVVVLKRLADAQADGDTVLAVITGHATNNDGTLKAGYSAPSVAGQAQVVADAQAMAGADPDSFSHLECHGTGTLVGDPIEVRALTQVFRRQTKRTQFCALGSVKAGIGHSNIAAGMAGLIKTVLALHHRQLPPLIGFREPNPALDLERSPFYINARLRDWPAGDGPRRAGVSCFGIGGTNSHLVLEEYVQPEPVSAADESPDEAPDVALTLSARTRASLQRTAEVLADRLETDPGLDPRDVAYTLRVGRERFAERLAVAGSDGASLAAALRSARPRTASAAVGSGLVFAFPGQGSQYPGMGAGLYERMPAFRRHYDECARILADEHEIDLSAVAFADGGGDEGGDGTEEFMRAEHLQPALFAVEYALARTLIDWGLRPSALVGHSLGEYVAACIAGVIDLPDALSLVMARAHAMEAAGPGAMLSVKLTAQEAAALVADEPDVDVGVVNSPGDVVISGRIPAIERLEGALADRGVGTRRLHTTRAFHSPMMTAAAAAVARQAESVTLRAPRIPILANLTGDWYTDEQATDPSYWGRHLRETVRFADNAAALLDRGAAVVLEVGPGRTLCGLVSAAARADTGSGLQAERATAPVTLPFMRHPMEERVTDSLALMQALGQAWAAGVDIDWSAVYPGQSRRRVPLPGYQFDGRRCWPDGADAGPAGADLGGSSSPAPSDAKLPLDEWFWLPSWKRTMSPAPQTGPMSTGGQGSPTRWLVLDDESGDGLSARLGAGLAARGDEVIRAVRPGPGREVGERVDDGTTMRVDADVDGLRRLLRTLAAQDRTPHRLLCLWPLADDGSNGGAEDGADGGAEGGADGGAEGGPTPTLELVALARALTLEALAEPLHAWVLTRRAVAVDAEAADPARATLLGPALVLSQENPSITCRVLDLPAGVAEATELLAARLVRELTAATPDEESIVAFRGAGGAHRWVPTYEPVTLPPGPSEPSVPSRPSVPSEPSEPSVSSRLRDDGVYVITGGLGRIGLTLAGHLAGRGATLVLTTRSAPTDPDVLARLRDLEAAGAMIDVVQADVGRRDDVRAALAAAVDRYGRVDGIFHAAGLAELTYLPDLSDDVVAREFAPKLDALRHLDAALAGLARAGAAPDFVVLFSSIAGVLGGLAMTAYMGANRAMDAFAEADPRRHGIDWVVLDFDDWDFDYSTQQVAAYTASGVDRFAMSPEQGVQVLERVLALREPAHLVVSTRPLAPRLHQWVRQHVATAPGSEPDTAGPDHASDGLAARLTSAYETVLGVSDIGADDNFFDLGGDSLLAAQILARLRRSLGLDGQLQLQDIFSYPSVAELAEHLEASR